MITGLQARNESFNPRTRRACDPSVEAVRAKYPVSIHARVERATTSSNLDAFSVVSFNPRTRRACDEPETPGRRRSRRFNPHTRRACDVGGNQNNETHTSFNPRTRRACDAIRAEYPSHIFGFNPRTRRACDQATKSKCRTGGFQSTHA